MLLRKVRLTQSTNPGLPKVPCACESSGALATAQMGPAGIQESAFVTGSQLLPGLRSLLALCAVPKVQLTTHLGAEDSLPCS